MQHATGLVIVEFLKHGGFPELQWQRAARTVKANRFQQLLAYSYHLVRMFTNACNSHPLAAYLHACLTTSQPANLPACLPPVRPTACLPPALLSATWPYLLMCVLQYRSVCHKPVAAQIALLGLLSFCCTLPAVRDAICATFAVTLMGDHFQYIDRLIEYINKIQGDYMKSAHAASFGAGIDVTTLIPAILHVRHAFEVHELGVDHSSEPVTTAQLVAARKLQNELLRICGRDLTVSTTHNACWHTGVPVNCDTGDYTCRRPVEWMRKVMQGRVSGKGRARIEHWRDFAMRMVLEHFFAY